ncbi:phage antirepressor KilAC domain-containing protein [Robbsia andropogonis]|uniref:phage antirepressor KilAC domain-containing protein n=1 Tax=Robbsia andropogonis TaxID=28092 RepID=UPI003D1AB8D9
MDIAISGSGDALRMTSQEIADLVEKRHDNVKRTIDQLANQGVISFPQIEEKPSTGGRPATEYVFTGEKGKRDSIVVVAQLSPEFTARLVDRWQELEKGAAEPAFAIPQTLSEALRLAADLDDKNRALEEKVEEAAPKVKAYDRIVDADGSTCLRDAASALHVQPSKFTQWLFINRWIYKRVGKSGWLAYQDKQLAGYLVHKITPYIDAHSGESKVSEQVRVTPKGMARLAQIVEINEKHGLTIRAADAHLKGETLQ